MALTIKQKILKQRGIAGFKPYTRTPLTHDEYETDFHKTPLMKYLEVKHRCSIEELLSSGTNYELEKQLGVDFTTISKWRKLIKLARQSQLSVGVEYGVYK